MACLPGLLKPPLLLLLTITLLRLFSSREAAVGAKPGCLPDLLLLLLGLPALQLLLRRTLSCFATASPRAVKQLARMFQCALEEGLRWHALNIEVPPRQTKPCILVCVAKYLATMDDRYNIIIISPLVDPRLVHSSTGCYCRKQVRKEASVNTLLCRYTVEHVSKAYGPRSKSSYLGT